MSAVIEATSCVCHTIGAPEEIRFCEEHHSYRFGDRKLVSFSKMLSTVYPQKREELDKIPPEVLEHARERGQRVDRYASEYARTGTVTVQAGEWQEVLDRVSIFVDWFDKTKPIVIGVQNICFSLDDGIAAMKDFDFVSGGIPAIVDLKCTASPDWTWKAQLGCHVRYSSYASEPTVGYSEPYILHINPKLYTRTGLKLIPYSTVECLRIFDAARAWFKELQRVKQ